MALGVDQAIAELLRDGDPAPDRLVEGLDGIHGWRLYDDADTTKRRIFIAEEPDEPDEIVAVHIEAGGGPIASGGAFGVGRQPGFTVRSRSLSYATAELVAHQCYEILDQYQGQLNRVPFFRIFANFEPFPIARDSDDEGGRFVFSQSFRSVTKRYALT